MNLASTDRGSPIRRDLSRFFTGWLVAANTLWLTTPWLEALAPTLGAAWLWTLVIPGSSLAALNPRRALGLLPTVIGLAAGAAVALTKPCRFRVTRAG